MIAEEWLEIRRLERRYHEVPYEKKRHNCSLEREYRIKTHPMGKNRCKSLARKRDLMFYRNLIGVFIVASVGLAVALLAFLLEYACGRSSAHAT